MIVLLNALSGPSAQRYSYDLAAPLPRQHQQYQCEKQCERHEQHEELLYRGWMFRTFGRGRELKTCGK